MLLQVSWSRSAREAFTTAFRSQGFKDDIDTLKESLAELKRLRKNAGRLRQQKQMWSNPSPASQSQDAVRTFKAARAASSDFHAFLQSAPACDKDSHSHHNIKLMLRCVPLQDSEEAKLTMLLEFNGQDGDLSLRQA